MMDNSKMKERVTLAQVAARAGLSTTAASLILNGRAGTGLSSDAHKRVREAAQQLGYRPNLMARSLRMEKSATLGFVSDMVASTRYASPMITGALRAARERQHTLLVVETEGDPAEQDLAVSTLLDRQVDGIILASARSHAVAPELPSLAVPVLLLNSVSADARFASVIPDEFEGGRLAAQHLVDRGFDRIHVLGASPETMSSPAVTVQVKRRLQGIYSVLDQAGAQAVFMPVNDMQWNPDEGYEAMTRLLAKDRSIKALLSLNDPLSFGAYQALQQAGLSIPDEVSVISFDDDDLVAYLRPRLTTVALPFEQMGRKAVNLILDGELEVLEHLEPMALRHRQSTLPGPDDGRPGVKVSRSTSNCTP